MCVSIRQEISSDYHEVESLVEQAFRIAENSDHREHLFVARLRKCGAFVPELSLVAVHNDGEIVGHIMLTRITIKNDSALHASLALAPLSVLPEYQKMGIGSKLIERSHRIAEKLGFSSIFVLGHNSYYPRFGYEQSSLYDVLPPFKVSPEYFMIRKLSADVLADISGTVCYPEEFFD
jgi:predicted N-acetyltransferase YhbS